MIRAPFLKVCGITRLADALAAVEAGARAIGFVLVPGSPRRVNVEAARAIAAVLPPGVARVGVTASLSPEAVRELAAAIGLTAVQAHGDESAELCRAYRIPVVKAFPAGPGFDPGVLEAFRDFPVLLDGAAGGLRGGTGRTADWSAARRAREAGHRVLLAGGLGPGNVLEAVRAAAPVAVDLNSGVETAPGIKDPDRIREAAIRLAALPPPEETAWPW